MAEVTHPFDGRTIERVIAEGLSLKGFTPKLHLSMLAAIALGSGFPNLNCMVCWQTASWQLIKFTMLYGWSETPSAKSRCQPL